MEEMLTQLDTCNELFIWELEETFVETRRVQGILNLYGRQNETFADTGYFHKGFTWQNNWKVSIISS